MSRLFDVDDIAVVTGASGDIGRAIALELAAEGAPVVVHYHTRAEAADAVVDAIRSKGGRAVRCRADLRDEEAVVRMFQGVRRRLGAVRLLVNCAGVIADGLAPTMSAERWHLAVDTNLTGAFHCTREALKPMVRFRRGAVVNIASVSGTVGTPGQVNYAASKAGLIGMTRALAREVGRYGIRVNAVAPGIIRTRLLDGVPPAVIAGYAATAALGRLCTPEEVASTASFLLSPRADGITGQTIAVDGGWTHG